MDDGVREDELLSFEELAGLVRAVGAFPFWVALPATTPGRLDVLYFAPCIEPSCTCLSVNRGSWETNPNLWDFREYTHTAKDSRKTCKPRLTPRYHMSQLEGTSVSTLEVVATFC
jgi:hypothetical protein